MTHKAKGKIHISRPINIRSADGPKYNSVEIEAGEAGGRKLIDVEIAEADVARMLLSSMQVPCVFEDHTGASRLDVTAAFKAGAAWFEWTSNLGDGPSKTMLEAAAKTYAERIDTYNAAPTERTDR